MNTALSLIRKILSETESAVPVNAATGAVAGIGAPPHGEPGVCKKNKKKLRELLRRK
jgi:hypothetical protein